MLTPEDNQAIQASIREKDPPADVLLRLERAGNDAFNAIRHALTGGMLSPQERVNALRRLSLLTRIQCFERKEEVLEIALEFLRDDNEVVRSGGANMVIGVTQLMERFPARFRSTKYGGPLLREQMQAAVRVALSKGLDEEQRALALRFLEP